MKPVNTVVPRIWVDLKYYKTYSKERNIFTKEGCAFSLDFYIKLIKHYEIKLCHISDFFKINSFLKKFKIHLKRKRA